MNRERARRAARTGDAARRGRRRIEHVRRGAVDRNADRLREREIVAGCAPRDAHRALGPDPHPDGDRRWRLACRSAPDAPAEPADPSDGAAGNRRLPPPQPATRLAATEKASRRMVALAKPEA